MHQSMQQNGYCKTVKISTHKEAIQENVISFIQEFPKELNLDKYIDYDLQFEKAFLEPLKSILDSIGWNVEKTANLDSFFT